MNCHVSNIRASEIIGQASVLVAECHNIIAGSLNVDGFLFLVLDQQKRFTVICVTTAALQIPIADMNSWVLASGTGKLAVQPR